MKILNQLYRYCKLKKLIAFSIFLTFFFSYQACKKNDELYSLANQEKSNSGVTAQSFFETKGTVSPKIQSIINMLKAEDEKTNFVSNLPKGCGLPIWQKTYIKQVIDNSGNNLGSDTLETIVVPLTQTNQSLSSIFVANEQTNGTYITNCYTTNGYLYNKVHDPSVDSAEAAKSLVWFMFMENITFGKTTFYHIPADVINNGAAIDVDGNRIIKQVHADTINNVGSPQVCWEYCCGVCGGGDPNCPNGGCQTICVDIDDDPSGGGGGGTGGGGGNGGGGTGGGGGGGGGGGTCTSCNPPPPNCNFSFYQQNECDPPPSTTIAQQLNELLGAGDSYTFQYVPPSNRNNYNTVAEFENYLNAFNNPIGYNLNAPDIIISQDEKKLVFQVQRGFGARIDFNINIKKNAQNIWEVDAGACTSVEAGNTFAWGWEQAGNPVVTTVGNVIFVEISGYVKYYCAFQGLGTVYKDYERYRVTIDKNFGNKLTIIQLED